jgi:hypothetical protein
MMRSCAASNPNANLGCGRTEHCRCKRPRRKCPRIRCSDSEGQHRPATRRVHTVSCLFRGRRRFRSSASPRICHHLHRNQRPFRRVRAVRAHAPIVPPQCRWAYLLCGDQGTGPQHAASPALCKPFQADISQPLIGFRSSDLPRIDVSDRAFSLPAQNCRYPVHNDSDRT